jgi:hypothetical protein
MRNEGFLRLYSNFPLVCCHGRMARGGHGLPKAAVSPVPAMPHPYTLAVSGVAHPQGWPVRRGGSPAGQAACGRLLPLWTPHVVRVCLLCKGRRPEAHKD